MRNSFSDSQLDRTIKKEEVTMGDYDENQSDNSNRANSSNTHGLNNITSKPLTNEEFAMLEATLQGQGKLDTNSTRYALFKECG